MSKPSASAFAAAPQEIEITLLLQRHRAGDPEALHQLLPFIYDELKRLARWWLKSQQPLWQPTELVGELFLSLFDGKTPQWNDRQHFFNTASLRLRSLLVDEARRQQANKRGAGTPHLSLDEALDEALDHSQPFRPEVLDLHEALAALALVYPRPAQIVELRFFAGLTETEIAVVLNLDERTVRRDWAFAKNWLLNYLKPPTA